MGGRIEPEPRGLDGIAPATASDECLEADDELRERERLGDVVVPACVEPRDPVDERIARRQEEDRGLHATRAECLRDIATVCIRQPDVDHEDVGEPARDAGEQLAARGHRVDGEPLLAQATPEHAAKLRIVLDDQHLHGCIIPPGTVDFRAQAS